MNVGRLLSVRHEGTKEVLFTENFNILMLKKARNRQKKRKILVH